MDKIKTIKIKNPDGTFETNTMYISADARNIDMANGENVQDTVGEIDLKDGSIAEQLKELKKDLKELKELIESLQAGE